MAACEAGLAAAPGDVELLFRQGVVHRLRGEPAEAARCWHRVLEARRSEQFSSVDAGLFGHVTRRNLAALAEERGDLVEAVRQWSAVLDERGGDPEASRALERLGPPPSRGGEAGP